MGATRPRQPRARRGPRSVGVLIFDGVTTLDAVGPADAFASARVRADDGTSRPAYGVAMLGITSRAVTSESGVRVHPRATLAQIGRLDTLVVPGGQGLREPTTQRRVARWIAANSGRYRRLVSICTGIYGVAPSGVLDGKRVTTHGRFADDVARRFPALAVDPDVSYVGDGRTYTSAGVMPGIELVLALIEEDVGGAVALGVARELVVVQARRPRRVVRRAADPPIRST